MRSTHISTGVNFVLIPASDLSALVPLCSGECILELVKAKNMKNDFLLAVADAATVTARSHGNAFFFLDNSSSHFTFTYSNL